EPAALARSGARSSRLALRRRARRPRSLASGVMRIGIDARYLSAQFSGIGAYSENLLKALARIDTDYEYVVFVHESLKRKLELGENFEFVRCQARPVSRGTLFGRMNSRFEN